MFTSVLITILSLICVVYSTKCYDILKEKDTTFWIWTYNEHGFIDKYVRRSSWHRYLDLLPQINGNFNPAKYIGDEHDKIHKFEYKDDNGKAISFSFNYKDGEDNPCKRLADHITAHTKEDHTNVIPLIQLSANLEFPESYTNGYVPTINHPFLIRPFQAIDNEILFIGKNDPKSPYKLRAAIYQNIYSHWFEKDKLEKNIGHYKHQNVFTKIKVFDEDYNNDKSHDDKLKQRYIAEIKKHPGIIIFGWNQEKHYGTKIGMELAVDHRLYDVQINNLWKHSKPFIDSIDKKRKELLDAISNKVYKDEETGKEYKLEGRIFDVYSYLDIETPPFENSYKWLAKKKPDYDDDEQLFFNGPNNNELTIFKSKHGNTISIWMMDQVLQDAYDRDHGGTLWALVTQKESTKYDYVLVEYDLERFRVALDKNFEEDEHDPSIDMVESIKTALTLGDTKIGLIDFPYTTILMSYILLGWEDYGKTKYHVQHQDALANIQVVIRNAVMANAINAIVNKDKLANKKIWVTVGQDHCGVGEGNEPMRDIQNIYSMQAMLNDPRNVVSYFRSKTKKIMWRLDPRPTKKEMKSYISINMENHQPVFPGKVASSYQELDEYNGYDDDDNNQYTDNYDNYYDNNNVYKQLMNIYETGYHRGYMAQRKKYNHRLLRYKKTIKKMEYQRVHEPGSGEYNHHYSIKKENNP